MADAPEQVSPLTNGGAGMTAVHSVKKIRKFRLRPRPSAVLRNLKSLLDNTQVTPELEKAVEAEILSLQNGLETAALFDAVTPAQSLTWMEPLWGGVPGEKKPFALTVFVATIGTDFESILGDALSRGEGLRSRILTSLGEELADQAAAFIERLVSDEARRESCELNERRLFSDPQDIRAALDLLDAGRLSIAYDTAGHLSPRFTRVGIFPWGPPAKKKK